MRTLNRPMFNMGGPIKEGVMHGIREPYAGGGRTLAGGHQIGIPMGNRTGFQDPTFWQKLAAQYSPKAFASPKKILSRLNPLKKLRTLRKIPGVASAEKWLGTLHPSRLLPPTGGITGTGQAGAFMQNLRSFPGVSKIPAWATKAKNLALQYPKTTALTALYGGPTVIEAGKNIPWSGIGGFLDPRPGWKKAFGIEDKVEEKITDKDKIKSIQENITWNPSGTGSTTPILTESMLEKVAETKAQRQKNKMLEIMGYDDSKKDAAYNALIDASQIIAAAPGGKSLDISRDIIQPAIAAPSKQFDKPKDIKEAVGLLMAKGEIEKDIAAGKGSATKQTATDLVNAGVFKTQKAALEHLAKTESIREKAMTWAGTMKKGYVDQETVIGVMDDTYGSRPQVLMSEEILEKAQKEDDYTSDLDVFVKLKDKKKLAPGGYVIGASGFIINSDGTVKQVLG